MLEISIFFFILVVFDFIISHEINFYIGST